MSQPLNQREKDVLDRLLLEAVKAMDIDKATLCVAKGANILKNDIRVEEEISPPGRGSSSTYVWASYVHLVMSRGSFDQAEKKFLDAFLALGADIDAKNENGNTALHIAAANAQSDRVEYLLSKKANARVVNKAMRTPLELVSEIDSAYVGRRRVVEMLLKAMPDVNETSVPKPETKNNNPAAISEDTPAADRIILKPRQKPKPGGGLRL